MRYELVQPPFSATTRAQVVGLYRAVFGGEVEKNVAHLESAKGSRCWLAWDGEVLAGLKWATERRPGELHSNLGMVAQGHRRRGIARTLLHRQRDWARERGFRRLTTNTYPHYLPMLLLNLDEGFELVGLRKTERGLKLLLERDFPPSPAPEGTDERGVRGRVALARALRGGSTIEGLVWDDGVVVSMKESR